MKRAFDGATFRDSLTRTRAARDVSWRKIADETGLEVTALHRILKGTVPDVDKYMALVDWMGCSPHDFFDSPPPSTFTATNSSTWVITFGAAVPAHKRKALEQIVAGSLRLLDSTE